MRLRLVPFAVATAALLSLSYPPVTHAEPAPTASIAEQRADAAGQAFTALLAQYPAGRATADEVGTWGRRWYVARRDAGLPGSALVAAAQDWVDKMDAFEKVASQRVQTGAAPTSDLQEARYFHLDAGMELARVKGL